MSRAWFIFSAVYLLFALPLSFIDSRKFRIPVSAVFAGIVVVLISRFYFINLPFILNLKISAFAVITSFLAFFCVRVFSDSAVGWDDILFGIMTSFYSGFYENLVAVVFAALLGILFYLTDSVISKKIKRNDNILKPIFAIPLVPFITAGAVFTKILFYVIA
ncbi:prepilin peptidase [Treponema sp.]|uniref:prepilin peptidase n=1 Tax=Treponema sp. TaxID=166 RepID=UPI00388E5FD0